MHACVKSVDSKDMHYIDYSLEIPKCKYHHSTSEPNIAGSIPSRYEVVCFSTCRVWLRHLG